MPWQHRRRSRFKFTKSNATAKVVGKIVGDVADNVAVRSQQKSKARSQAMLKPTQEHKLVGKAAVCESLVGVGTRVLAVSYYGTMVRVH